MSTSAWAESWEYTDYMSEQFEIGGYNQNPVEQAEKLDAQDDDSAWGQMLSLKHWKSIAAGLLVAAKVTEVVQKEN